MRHSKGIARGSAKSRRRKAATAVWQGTLKEGGGTLDTQSKVLNATPYSFRSRFGDGVETNPEELIAAAHAGCFTMALSKQLGDAGFPAERLTTNATLSLDQVGSGFSITAVHLELTAKVPGLDAAKFEALATGAKENCPVSKVLNAKITLAAKLE